MDKLKNLFLNVEQCKHLIELGFDMSDSKIVYLIYPSDKKHIEEPIPTFRKHLLPFITYKEGTDIISTYSLQELLNSLLLRINNYELFIDYNHNSVFYYDFVGKKEFHCEQSKDGNILNSAYQMLCWLLENKYLKTKEL